MEKLSCVAGCSYMTEDRKIRLVGADGAARRFKSTLIKRFGYNKNNITMLLDAKDPNIGTVYNILLNLDNMICRANRKKSVLFFYSGHGGSKVPLTNEISDYHLHCSKGTKITGSELKHYMDKAASLNISLTVVLDCCRSAGLFQGLANEQLPPITELFTNGVKLKSPTVSSPIMIAA